MTKGGSPLRATTAWAVALYVLGTPVLASGLHTAVAAPLGHFHRGVNALAVQGGERAMAALPRAADFDGVVPHAALFAYINRAIRLPA